MAFVLFLCLLAVTASPIHKLAQRVLEYDATHLNKPKSNHLLERCLAGYPVLLESSNLSHLPSDGRPKGDPCAYNAQCARPNICLCQPNGGKECAPATCTIDGVQIPADGRSHRVNCQLTCQCQGDGFGCVDTCPLNFIQCPPDQEAVQVPVDECCFTWQCRTVAQSRLTWQSWYNTYMVTGEVNADSLLAQVHPSTAGYCTKDVQSFATFSNRAMCGSSTKDNIGELITIEWNQDCDQTGSFRMGVDWGFGGGLIVDGVLVRSTIGNSDVLYRPLFWYGDWNTDTAVFTITKLWTKGHHVVQYLGFEQCCDGDMALQFKAKNAADWSVLTNAFLTEKFGPCTGGCVNEVTCPAPADPLCFFGSPERDANGCVTACGPMACA